MQRTYRSAVPEFVADMLELVARPEHRERAQASRVPLVKSAVIRKLYTRNEESVAPQIDIKLSHFRDDIA
jgi:hypothetical protein